MKKQLTTALLVFTLLLTMAGCSASRLENRMDVAEERMEQRMDALENAVEEAIRQNAAPAMAPETPVVVPQKIQPVIAETAPQAPKQDPAPAVSDQISQEQAQQIALDYVGLKADQVQRLRTSFEVDDGIPQYDVEFLEGGWEYEFEIDADTGKILSFDKDHKYD